MLEWIAQHDSACWPTTSDARGYSINNARGRPGIASGRLGSVERQHGEVDGGADNDSGKSVTSQARTSSGTFLGKHE